jgi:hypothetical protein
LVVVLSFSDVVEKNFQRLSSFNSMPEPVDLNRIIDEWGAVPARCIGQTEQAAMAAFFVVYALYEGFGRHSKVAHNSRINNYSRIVRERLEFVFKRAGLPYRGTHAMRHGGCRRVFNEAGELPVAQQLLGNSDLKTTLIYAKRKASALTDVVHRHWEKSLEGKKPARLLASACNEHLARDVNSLSD